MCFCFLICLCAKVACYRCKLGRNIWWNFLCASSFLKKTKGAPEARKQASEVMKIFFSDPENRRKRSLSLKGTPFFSLSQASTQNKNWGSSSNLILRFSCFSGVKFFCSNCGEEGHRKFYCPKLKRKKGAVKFSCSMCGKKGHNKRSCSRKTEGYICFLC